MKRLVLAILVLVTSVFARVDVTFDRYGIEETYNSVAWIKTSAVDIRFNDRLSNWKTLRVIRKHESNNNYNASSKWSTAFGAYQLLNGTAKILIKKYNKTHRRMINWRTKSNQDKLALLHLKENKKYGYNEYSNIFVSYLNWQSGCAGSKKVIRQIYENEPISDKDIKRHEINMGKVLKNKLNVALLNFIKVEFNEQGIQVDEKFNSYSSLNLTEYKRIIKKYAPDDYEFYVNEAKLMITNVWFNQTMKSIGSLS